jgi:hypothetical protein
MARDDAVVVLGDLEMANICTFLEINKWMMTCAASTRASFTPSTPIAQLCAFRFR